MNNCTVLKDRTLWYDGDSTIKSQDILRLSTPGNHSYVDKLTPEMIQYNKYAAEDERIDVKRVVRDLDTNWNIPNEFKNMDVNNYVYDKLLALESQNVLSEKQIQLRMVRTAMELALFHNMGLYDVLKTIIFVIHTFEQKGVVWGVGRGSSVASYVLYLIGVHDIDSVEYGLDIAEFLH